VRSRLTLAVLSVAVAVFALPAVPANAVNVAHASLVSADPADNTPQVLDGQVRTMAVVGNDVVVGGTFTQIRNQGSTTILDQPYLFAFDRATGQIDTNFLPVVDKRVEALAAAPDGHSVFVGGYFGTVNGTPRSYLTKLDVATGIEDPVFRSTTTLWVRDLVVRGNTLFVAGAFCKIRGIPRCGLAAVDATTGKVNPNLDLPFLDPRIGTRQVIHIDVTPDASKLVAIGNFTHVAGLDRTEVAVLNLGDLSVPATVADWETDRWKAACSTKYDSYITDVDISPDGTYFVLVSTGAGFAGTLCDSATRWELSATGSGLQPTWIDYTGGDSLTQVAITGAAIYVGGHQRWENNTLGHDSAAPSAVPRAGLAALDPANGLPYSWNPGRSRGRGVFALVSTDDGLYLGSDTTKLGGEFHARTGFFPVAGGAQIPQSVAGTLPNDLYALPLSGGLVKRSFDGATFGPSTPVASSIDWSHVRGAFMISGRLYTGQDDGHLLVRTFDGSTFGVPVDLNSWTSFASVSGMFFDGGRIYYTLTGDPNLYYRYFTPESGVVGADAFVVSGNGDGRNWSNVNGMTMANGTLYYALKGNFVPAHHHKPPSGTPDGNLYALPFSGGTVGAGTPVLVSGPSTADTFNWMSRGLFVLSP
jgi:hypothetical protein